MVDGDAAGVVDAYQSSGCLETVAMLSATPFGDVAGFARRYAPEGLIVYLEVAESDALTAAKLLHHVRLSGRLDATNAVLIGRSGAPDSESLTQFNAIETALGDLGVPVLYDLDLGHVSPQPALGYGALATVELDRTPAHSSNSLSDDLSASPALRPVPTEALQLVFGSAVGAEVAAWPDGEHVNQALFVGRLRLPNCWVADDGVDDP